MKNNQRCLLRRETPRFPAFHCLQLLGASEAVLRTFTPLTVTTLPTATTTTPLPRHIDVRPHHHLTYIRSVEILSIDIPFTTHHDITNPRQEVNNEDDDNGTAYLHPKCTLYPPLLHHYTSTQHTINMAEYMLTRPQDLRVGNKYRIGRKIGSGSFGDIYLGAFAAEIVMRSTTNTLRRY